MPIKTTRENSDSYSGVEERLEALERELKAVRDREKIRDGIYRYCTAIDRCDLDLLKSCYHPDAVDVHAKTYCGNAMKFAEYIIPEMQKLFSVHHSIGNVSMDLEGDQAFVQSQFRGLIRVNLVDADPAQGYVEYQSVGRYLDIWEDRGGNWRISFRYLVDDGNAIRLIKDQTPLQHTGSSGKSSRDDPYYLGFGITGIKNAEIDGIDVAALLRSRFIHPDLHQGG
jgi:ketosteroid isomerase-like protein